MRIALPARDGHIDDHFGHCDYFCVVTIEDGRVVAEQRVDPPAGCGCKSNIVTILAEMGVTVMLAGNMGQGAVNILGSHGIRVYRGCSGELTGTVERWLAGTVVDSGQHCAEHHSCQE